MGNFNKKTKKAVVVVNAVAPRPIITIPNRNQAGDLTNAELNQNEATKVADFLALHGDPNKAGDEGGQTGCPTKIHTLAHWFNPCAFSVAPPGELGTSVRAPMYGPRFVNTDFSLVKDVPLSFREGTALQFRAEFFNLLNHPQFYLQGAAGT